MAQPPPSSFEGMRLSLAQDCIFVQLQKDKNDEPRAVVLRHKPKSKQRNHYTPLNDSARMLLSLLTRNNKHETGTKKGIHFDDLVKHLVRRYQVTVPVAKEALNGFLRDLAGFELLNWQEKESDPVDDNYYTYMPGEARGHIVEGGTLISVGYTINWWRP